MDDLQEVPGSTKAQVCRVVPSPIVRAPREKATAHTGGDQQNLARIRDNQRRSRARRKEYLQELETKYRHCEQVGVEASAEIQAAARQVLDENKRLRDLLKRRGLSDAEINGRADYLENTPLPAPAAYNLEGMLSARRACGPGSACGSSDECSISTGQSCAPAISPQIPSPPIPSNKCRPSSSTARLASDPDRTRLASIGSQPSSTIPTPTNGAQFSGADGAMQYNAPPTLPQHTMNYDEIFNDDLDWSQHIIEPIDYQLDDPKATDAGSSSCYAAAGAIRSINPNVGYELEEELGCSNGTECDVSNSDIFKIMDRYQGEPV